ncbi:MAG: PAS domain S-box protein [Syntrophobacterales bacterium]|nr:MAG: PAS domain S-box protein [Syntrophobacterales bacterium]
MKKKIFGGLGLRLFILTQVFTTLIVLATGFFAIEINRKALLRRRQPTIGIGQVKRALENMRIEVLIGGVVACLSGVALTFAITKPLKKLIEGVQSAAVGDFTKIIDVPSQYEFSQLVDAYNQMLSSLKKSEEHLRKVFYAADDAIMTTDREGRVTLWSESSERMFGYGKNQIVGKDLSTLHSPKMKPDFIRIMQESAMKKGRWQGEIVYSNNKGHAFDGWCVMTTLTEETGEIVGYLSVVRDMTEKKQMEMQLIQADKMASLGELAAGVAHEINNPLSGILSNAEFLQEEIPEESEERQEEIREIIENSQRIKTIVQDLLNFSRQRDSKTYTTLDISAVIASSLNLTEHQINLDRIKIIKEIGETLPFVKGSFNQLEQVFINLLSNARYALNQKYPSPHEDKTLLIRTDQVEGDGRKYVRIEFIDRGIGIPEESMDKVLNPFFTTKEQGQGTGLGLSISFNIIQEHNGAIRFESKEGEYTKVTVDLPVYEEDIENDE